MDRIILHCDCNSYFASVETILRPELSQVPMAVAGDPDSRHGIILAKNEKAKAFHVETAEPIWQAKRKCPDLVCVPPHHKLYGEYSKRINQIYLSYTDLVDPFSVDESFLDVTHSIHLFRCTPKELADQIRERVRKEIGLTISVGVSFCRVFAKLGSDMKKPDATTVIPRESFQEIVWPLPVTDLLFVGRQSEQALRKLNIRTIGDLARTDRVLLGKALGKQGDTLWRYANGLDKEPVLPYDAHREIKSVGNSMTFRRDLRGEEEIRSGIAALADSVATRLRAANLKCTVVQVGIKSPEFKYITRQVSLSHSTYLQKELTEIAMELVRKNWNLRNPVRLLSITGTGLVPADEPMEQTTLFDDCKGNANQEKLEDAMAVIRKKYGKTAIRFGYQPNKELGIDKEKTGWGK